MSESINITRMFTPLERQEAMDILAANAQSNAEAAAIAADAARFRWLVDHSPSDLGEASDIRAAFDRVMAREGGGK